MRSSLSPKKIGIAIAGAVAISISGAAVAHAETLEVPDVAGMTVLEATETLNAAGFDDVVAVRPWSDDEVLGTNYEPGSYVDENTTILLITPSR